MKDRSRGLPLQATICDINVTNLVDVTMVLLIVFILIAPMIENRVEVSLPEMENFDEKEDPEIVAITVTKDKQVLWDKEKIPLERLMFRLRKEKNEKHNLAVLLRADRKIDYGFVMDVMDRIKGSGVEAIDLATSLKKRQ